ncbi:hypothetical protein HPB47_023720 [Ixodes persulcatus]|uniref:Uncharacterized protein n=1 Tax=Ixodes persulcatus TaxID=34615 RepID=A0AC60Q6F5_IXOPE|nr:hypothetical protein HPB47_023720 [Ixodes persulcatus]
MEMTSKQRSSQSYAEKGDHIAMRENTNLQDGALPPVLIMSRRSIFKNVVVVSSGFLLLFTAFQSVSNLQSSINSEQGLGTYTLATIYVALVVSCMFVPAFMISRLGLKYTLVVSMLMYTVYFMANFYPTWFTMIPASIILGLGGAPLWTAKCAYLTTLASEYARQTGQKTVDVVTRFFGVFFMIFQTAQIWGNLISYYVLKPGGPPANATLNFSVESCGANFVTAEEITDNANLQPPDNSKLYTLMSIYTVCAFLSALSVLVLLDPIATQPNGDTKKRSSFGLLVETLRHMRKPYQWAIVPLTIYSGVEQAFLVGDFTQATFYGIVFADSEEGAFANYRLWESLGFIVAFAVQKVLLVTHKLLLLTVLLSAGMIGYLFIEIHLKLKKRRKLTLQS